MGCRWPARGRRRRDRGSHDGPSGPRCLVRIRHRGAVGRLRAGGREPVGDAASPLRLSGRTRGRAVPPPGGRPFRSCFRNLPRSHDGRGRSLRSPAHRDALFSRSRPICSSLFAAHRSAARGAPASPAPAAACVTIPRFVCPACGGALAEQADALACTSCGRSYPILFGIPDLRLSGDRYLSLEDDPRRARELFEAAAEGRSFNDLLAFYWEKTESTPSAVAGRHVAGVLRGVEEARPMIQSLSGGRFLDIGCGAGGSLVAALERSAFSDLVGI